MKELKTSSINRNVVIHYNKVNTVKQTINEQYCKASLYK